MPKNDEIADWIADLAEIDGYYAGLASSALDGARASSGVDLSHLEKLEAELRLLSLKNENQSLVIECRNYLESLRSLADLIPHPKSTP